MTIFGYSLDYIDYIYIKYKYDQPRQTLTNEMVQRFTG